VLTPHLASDHWPTRAAAIRSLGFVRKIEAIELLIARLEKEEGRLRWDIALSLSRLTGKMLGYTAEPWNEWWKVARASFVFAGEEGHAEIPEAATKAYYGIPLLSKRVTFCIDASGSMNMSVQARPISRLEDARRVLKATLKELDADVEFNIILFRDSAEAWRSGLQPATEDNVTRAIDAMAKAKADGGTNIFGTLAMALADPEVDTVFLLSDGEPSEGTIVDPGKILREIGAMNRTRLVVIHTIALAPSPFLKSLSAMSGGKHVER
jgi:HEAT repeat protein